MIWFLKKKHIEKQIKAQKVATEQSNIRSIQAVEKADKDMMKLHDKLAANGITFNIHVALGGKHER